MPTRNRTPATHAADRIAGECLARRVRLLNRTITGIYDEALRPMGLTSAQLNLLVVVAKRGPLSPGEVARRMNMEKSTVSRNLDRMRQNGWVRVGQSDAGRKQVLTARTAIGHGTHNLIMVCIRICQGVGVIGWILGGFVLLRLRGATPEPELP